MPSSARQQVQDSERGSGDRATCSPSALPREYEGASRNLPADHSTQTNVPQNRNGSRGGNGRRTKAALNIATLNLCGRGPLNSTAPVSKWNALNQLARERKMGVIALQETHLTDDAVAQIHTLYGWRLRIIHSAAPTNPSAVQGVAFALNRELVDIANIEVAELVPGRALMIKLHWHADRSLTLLNVYAPNTNEEQIRFWPTLSQALNRNTHLRPDVVLGDFNVVEEAIDRLPAREDPPARVASYGACPPSPG